VSPALTNFLFEAVNFLILAAVLGRVLFSPVRKAIAAERERQEALTKEVEQLRQEAATADEKMRLSRQRAEEEGEEAKKQIIEGARKEAAELLRNARATRHSEREALEKELEASRQAQAEALAGLVGRIAADAVRDLLSSLSGPSLDTALIRAACTRLDGLPAEARKKALVECARPLDAEQRALLAGVLGERMEERVVPELGAGVRVTTAGGQVDASAASVARRTGRAVREADRGAEIGGDTDRGADATGKDAGDG
jgi:F0F1-type ATP synthase membrane subunit b/b'